MHLDKHTWNLVIGALKGTLDDGARREFDAWNADPEHRVYFDNLTRIWQQIQRHAAAYEPDRDRLWEQLRQRIGAAEAGHGATAEARPETLHEALGRTPRETKHQAPQATLHKTPHEAPKRPRIHLLRTAAAVAAAVAATLFISRPDLLLPPAPPAEQQIRAFEGKSQAQLADGTTVWLHGGSTLTYDTRFGSGERRVRLRGEGFFEVAKDSKRPFTVEVEGLRVRVLGTRFNVRTSRTDGTVSVSLVEGAVELDAANGIRHTLRPGQIARYDRSTGELVVAHGNVAMESCWAAGKLTFERQPLGEICRYMARWYDTEIRIAPALARNYAYTFTVTDEPLEEILRIMSRINPIVYTFSKDNSVTISEIE